MEMPECAREGHADIHTVTDCTAGIAAEFRGERFRSIRFRIDLFRATQLIIGELHDIIIEPGLIITPDVQHIDESGMILGNLLVALNSLEFPFESLLVFEVLATHDFDSAIHSGNGTGKKYLTVGSATNATEDFKIGN
jgi:hypothetical protein